MCTALQVDRLGRGHGFLGHTHFVSDFVQHFADEFYMFDNAPESITRFWGILPSALANSSGDFKAFARELFMSDYDMGDGGHVFSTS